MQLNLMQLKSILLKENVNIKVSFGRSCGVSSTDANSGDIIQSNLNVLNDIIPHTHRHTRETRTECGTTNSLRVPKRNQVETRKSRCCTNPKRSRHFPIFRFIHHWFQSKNKNGVKRATWFYLHFPLESLTTFGLLADKTTFHSFEMFF